MTSAIMMLSMVSAVYAVDPAMVVYEVGAAIPESELVDLGPADGLGGTVLEGEVNISARFDLFDANVAAGVFQATYGEALIVFPFTEHATILDGEVTITDMETGDSWRLRPGDSYFIRQGTVVLWDVDGERVQKSFYNIVEDADAPAPVRVYEAHARVDQDDLIDLGPPEDIGGTVLDGDPHVYGRIDFFAPPMVAGVFQGQRATVEIDFPFTEHAAVMNGKVTLTDLLSGTTHTLRPGDAYLILRGADILWEVEMKKVQKSFFNSTEP